MLIWTGICAHIHANALSRRKKIRVNFDGSNEVHPHSHTPTHTLTHHEKSTGKAL